MSKAGLIIYRAVISTVIVGGGVGTGMLVSTFTSAPIGSVIVLGFLGSILTMLALLLLNPKVWIHD